MEERTNTLQPLLTAGQVAAILGLSKPKVYAMLYSGELEAVRLRKCVRVRPTALEEFVEEHITEVA
jgi:excisionase family DNA binding protein